ncbi:MAG: CRISPR-associated endonuclease Cas2 [Acidobacteria bacterium]|nr:MAG: CRISPR-associated endonuclease Cas2 [Acidobacteriota bacterium]GIU81978.1 MAG: CRISPR-associated endoribonuclease Cas2 [Pyrinomonadaceae bacterium]
MRNRYIVSYDIADGKRWRRVYKKMRGFGDPIQYSVFLCDLLPTERIMMIEALTEIINHKEDRVLIVDVGPAKGTGEKRIKAIGKQLVDEEKIAIIV